jgi:hypothetical protein
VSTIPGLIDIEVTSGSSTLNVKAKWFMAALVEPYNPQLVYADVAAPDDVKMILPFTSRRDGSAAFA